MLTVVAVIGGYSLAPALEVSGRWQWSGSILIGNHGRRDAMSDRTREQLDGFWEVLDSMRNAVLFMLIGFEALLLPFSGPLFAAGLLAASVTLLVRFLSAGPPVAPLGQHAVLP